MGLEFLAKGRVSRALPQRDADGGREGEPMRVGTYDELYVQTPGKRMYVNADEGTYFVTNNGQTGIASPTGTAFSATVGMLSVYNSDSPGNTAAKRLYLDYLALITTAAGSFASAGVNLQAVLTIDNGDRYSSGGTDLSANVVSPNMDGSARSSVAKVRFGNLTLTAATGAARTVCGLRILRPVVSTTVADVVGETKLFNFGGAEAMIAGSITIANANQIPIPLPPVILGPNQSALIHFIMNGTTPGAVSFAPELGHVER